MKKIAAAFSLALLVTGSSAIIAAKPAARAAAKAWDDTFTLTAEGNTVMGNPNAPVRLVEFISYTCGHCAQFSVDSNEELRTGMVRKGEVAVELRPVIRVDIDIVPSLLAICGPKEKHFGNSHAILAAQGQWFKEPSDPTYKERWGATPADRINQVIARDLGLYAIMQQRGYTEAELDACMADKAQTERLTKVTNEAFGPLGVTGTPSFLINGKLQSVYGWASLKPLLASALPRTGTKRP